MAITVDITTAATQDSVSDMKRSEMEAAKVHSSYALPRHYGNKNIFERWRDLSNAVYPEF